MQRVRFNQPSTLQPYHALHGRIGVADMRTDAATTTVYFTEGAVHSMQVLKSALAVLKLSSAED